MRPLKDEYGNEYPHVDDDMRLRLEAKLVYSIVTGFNVIPATGHGALSSPFQRPSVLRFNL